MKKSIFIKNVLILLFSQGIIKALGIVYKLYLTNKTGYGDTGNALFVAAFQIYIIFLTICSIGVPNAISCLISEKFAEGKAYDAYRILKVALVIFGSLGFISSSILFLFAKIISDVYLQMPETVLIIKILSPSIFIVSISSVLKGYFNGKQKIKTTANSLLIEQSIRTICTIILVEILSNITKNNTGILVCAVAIASTFSETISFIYISSIFLKTRREIWTDIITSKIQKKERIKTIVKNIIKISFPIALCALIAMGNKTIDALTIVRILKKYIGEKEALKQYGILSGKIESLVLFPVSFNMAFTTAMIPAISEQKAKGKFEKAKELLKRVMLTGILIGIPFFVIMFAYANPILNVLFPNASDGFIMLKYSSIIIIIAILIQTINSYLQGMHKMRIQIISISIGCFVKLLLNLILINNKQIGIYGAVISNILSYLCILIVSIIYLIKKAKVKFPKKEFIVMPILLIVCLYGILRKTYDIVILNNNVIRLGISGFAGCLIYFILIIIIFKIKPKRAVK